MDRALLIEEKNAALSKKGGLSREKSDWKTSNPKFRSTWGASNDKKEGWKGGGSSGEKNSEGVKGRRLSSAELEERHKKGLCFKCGDKWNKEHVCKFKHMQLLLCEIEEEEKEGNETEGGPVTEVEELKTLQLSLQSKEGLTSNKSFKVWGEIEGRRVLTLIDSGATSNFIAPGLVEEMKIVMEDTPVYLIEVGTGELVRNRGVCKDMKFSVQGVQFTQNFFLMELGGTELVLGMDWLASLGSIEANFRNLSLKWTQEGQQCTIMGDPALSTIQASWKAVMKAIQGEGLGFLVECIEDSVTENRRTMGTSGRV